MRERKENTTHQDALDGWVQEREGFEEHPHDLLAVVMARARAISEAGMSEEDGVRAWEDLRSTLALRRQQWRRRWMGTVAAGLASVAAVTVAVAARSSSTSRPPVVVKEVLFESERAGKLVRLEMTVYRAR